MPENKQRRVVITGANTGIGYYTALELAKRGDHVTLACRNKDKADAAAAKISAEAPRGTVDTATLNLADLASVREYAASAPESIDPLRPWNKYKPHPFPIGHTRNNAVFRGPHSVDVALRG